MIQKVIINVLNYSSVTIQWLCGVFIVFGVIGVYVFLGSDANKIFNGYYNVIGSYWFLRVLALVVISHIIEVGTNPFVGKQKG
jgi:hypothetical protein